MIESIIMFATNDDDVDMREKAFDCLISIVSTSYGKILLQKVITFIYSYIFMF